MSGEIPYSVVALLSSHMQPSAGRKSMLLGSQVQPIADTLASDFSDHQFDIAADLQSFFANDISGSRPEAFESLCLLDAFSEVGKLEQERALATVRNVLSCRVLHLQPQQDGEQRWKLTDSLALGYRRVGSIQTDQTLWQLYEYNISNYKTTPAWLNADQWSNPQYWDRFRW